MEKKMQISVLTYIPKNNLSQERKCQCENVTKNYFICHNKKDLVKHAISGKYQYFEIWYPQHLLLYFVIFPFIKRLIYSPVICNIEWFFIRKKWGVKNYRYDLRRLRYLVLDFFSVNLSCLVFVQDRAFVDIWANLLITRAHRNKIVEVCNNFPEQITITEKKCDGALIISHDAEHKTFLLSDELLSHFDQVLWAGRTKAETRTLFSNVLFIGQQNRLELDKYIKSSQYLLVPSIFEGSPRVVYEALPAGCLIVCAELLGLSKLRRLFSDYFLDLQHGYTLNISNTHHMKHEKFILWNRINERRKYTALRNYLWRGELVEQEV